MPGGAAAHRLTALNRAAWLAESLGELADARSLAEEALRIAQDGEDELGIATASLVLGRSAFRAGDLDAARGWLAAALAGSLAQHATGRVAWAQCFLGLLRSRVAIDDGGDASELAWAAALGDEALASFRAVDFLPGIARALHVCALVAYKRRDLARSLALLHELLTMTWEHRHLVHACLEDIADIAGRLGQPSVAARLYGAVSEERRLHGIEMLPVYQAEAERDLAVARQALGETAFAAGLAAGRSMPREQAVAEALAFAEAHRDRERIALTPRERAILPLLAEGRTAKEVGEALFLSHRTVEYHVANLLAKLGVRTRTEAIEAARARGLLPLPGRSHEDLVQTQARW
jgi:DNA-binding CsgD family transcriptional regulator